MKKLLLILLCLPLMTLAQQTYVPDDNFEQALINLGYDNVLDDYVQTSSIDTITLLSIPAQGIFDLTGIEDFSSLALFECSVNNLTTLNLSNNSNLMGVDCSINNLTTLDLSNKQSLIFLACVGNQLTSINVTNCPSLFELVCDSNQLISLDLSDNYNLRFLGCGINYITELDLSNNPNLEELHCPENLLNCLNLKSGGNQNIYHITADSQDTLSLSCVEVDDLAYSNSNWISNPDFYFDIGVSFSENCNNACSNSPTLFSDIGHKNKTLSKIVNILGENVLVLEVNKIYFHIYDDGTVEKRITIE